MSTENTFPTDIGFDEAETQSLSKGKRLRETKANELYCFVIADATNKVSDNTASLMTEYLTHPLRVDGDPSSKDESYKQKVWLVWPKAHTKLNPETGKREPVINPKTGKPHEAPATGGLVAGMLHAFLGDKVVQSMARKPKGAKMFLIDGDPASKEAADERELLVNKQVTAELTKMSREGPSHHVGMIFYAGIKYEEGNPTFANFYPSVPNDKILITDF